MWSFIKCIHTCSYAHVLQVARTNVMNLKMNEELLYGSALKENMYVKLEGRAQCFLVACAALWAPVCVCVCVSESFQLASLLKRAAVLWNDATTLRVKSDQLWNITWLVRNWTYTEPLTVTYIYLRPCIKMPQVSILCLDIIYLDVAALRSNQGQCYKLFFINESSLAFIHKLLKVTRRRHALLCLSMASSHMLVRKRSPDI